MKKITTISLISITILIALFFLSDFIIFNIYAYEYKKRTKSWDTPKFQYAVSNPRISKVGEPDYFSGIWVDRRRLGRLPDGLKSKNTHPITVFGCSYTYGLFLNETQTFTYKLASILKRPIYNRAAPGGSPVYMYLQSTKSHFYNDVPPSDTVIYIMINDHYRRMFGETFNIVDNFLYIHYKNKNGTLVMDNYENKLLNFFKFSYTLRLIRHKFKNAYINNEKNADKITDEFMIYFIKTKENLEKNWNIKIKNFYVIFYENVLYPDILRKKLENNNFIVIETNQLTSIDLNSEKYKMKDNGHPNEEAWNLLTPLIAKKLQEV